MAITYQAEKLRPEERDASHCPEVRLCRRPTLHLIRIYRFQLLPRGRTGCFVGAGVPPAVAGGILPPGPTPGFQPGSQIIQPSREGVRFSAGRDARLYGRQDARRYHKLRIRCRPNRSPPTALTKADGLL
jgi:hypothetical protein